MFFYIPDYPDYMINYEGIVKSFKADKCRILKQTFMTSGYKRVCLVNESGRKCYEIHILMRITFLNNIYGINDVYHKDHDKTNNRLWNLKGIIIKPRKKRSKNVIWYNKSRLRSGIKNIYSVKNGIKDEWIFRKKVNNKFIQKSFVSLQNAIDFKMTCQMTCESPIIVPHRITKYY